MAGASELLQQTQQAEQMLENGQLESAGTHLLAMLKNTPAHLLKPYWIRLLTRAKSNDLTPYITEKGLLPYYYWWRTLALPPEACASPLSQFIRTLHQASTAPVFTEKKDLEARLDCIRTLPENHRTILAKILIEQRFYAESEKILANAHTHQGLYLKGLAQQKQAHYKAAFQTFQQLMKLPTQTPQETELRKQTILEMGFSQQRMRHYQDALKWWAWISPQDQKFYPQALWYRAMLAFARDRDKEGYRLLTTIYQKYPHSEHAPDAIWYHLRLAIRDYQSNPQLIPLAQQLLQKYPHHQKASAARYWLARSLEQRNKTQQARQSFAQLAKGPLNDYYTHAASCQLHHLNCYQLFYKSLAAQSPQLPFLPKYPALSELVTQNKTEMLQTVLPFTDLNAMEQDMVQSLLFLKTGDYFRSIRTIWRYETHNTDDLRLMYPLHYSDLIRENANRYQLPEALIAGLTWQESMYRADIRSWAGAIGLMQLMPQTAAITARQAGVQPFYTGMLIQPEVNIRLGSFYLKQQLTRWDNNPILTLATYNAGPTPTAIWKKRFGHLEPDVFIEQIPYRETRNYVRQVLKHYWVYSTTY